MIFGRKNLTFWPSIYIEIFTEVLLEGRSVQKKSELRRINRLFHLPILSNMTFLGETRLRPQGT